MVTETDPTPWQEIKAFLIYCSPRLHSDLSLFKEISSERQWMENQFTLPAVDYGDWIYIYIPVSFLHKMDK